MSAGVKLGGVWVSLDIHTLFQIDSEIEDIPLTTPSVKKYEQFVRNEVKFLNNIPDYSNYDINHEAGMKQHNMLMMTSSNHKEGVKSTRGHTFLIF